MNEIVVVGGGPGTRTQEALRELEQADLIFARHPEGLPAEKYQPLLPFSESLPRIRDSEGRRVVLLTGDVSCYSLLPQIRRLGPVRVVPGLGALQLLCARLGEMWTDAAILSGHGRVLSETTLRRRVSEHASTFLYCDAEHDAAWAASALSDMPGLEMAVGSRLGGEEEQVFSGPLERFCGRDIPHPQILRIHNPHPEPFRYAPGMADAAFQRGAVPMTKRVPRMLAVSMLNLSRESVVWDIGAGTGSVSVECAGIAGDVYAVEQKEEAIALIRANAALHHASNLHVVEGTAPDVLSVLPRPDAVFIGGTGGRLEEIVDACRFPGVRVVTTAVTPESICRFLAAFRDWRMQATQVAVSNLTPGKVHILQAENPITIFEAFWEG